MNKFEVRNMDLYYGSFHALKNINIDIPEKEITAFIGPSGCGKSTFLKSLNRMNDLVEGCRISGDIKLDGVDIYKDKMDVNVLRKRVGMVFQKPNPFPMSIYDNIAYGPRTHGIRNKAQLDEIVERSLRGAAIWDEVKDRLNKSALGMSGGQQQRLCIARALAVEQRSAWMDEPTSALDPISTSKVEELATELKENYTIVMVTPQHAAGRAYQRQDGIFPAGRAGGDGPDGACVRHARGQAHRGLHLGPLRLRRYDKWVRVYEKCTTPSCCSLTRCWPAWATPPAARSRAP